MTLRISKLADNEFLATVYADTRHEELTMLGWNAEQEAAFCMMQFQMQAQAYQIQFLEAVSYIIENDGRAIGCLLIQKSEEAIRIIDIALLNEFRSNGFGTSLLKSLQAQGKAASKRLELSVSKTNYKAKRLYERLGFFVASENQTHFEMRWQFGAE